MITTEAVTFSVQLIARAAVLAARWAGYVRYRMLHCPVSKNTSARSTASTLVPWPVDKDR